MKAFLFSLFILSAFWSIAQSGHQNKKAFKVITDSLNLNLSANQSKFTFIIDERDIEKTAFPVTLYGLVNGLRKEIVSDDQGRFSIVVDSGKVNLQIQISHGNFYYQTGILELEILEQHETTGFLRFEKKEPPRVVPCKPVIYFHTASKQEFDLSVKPVGEFTFVYPEMNDSWKGTAYPNGDITINGNNYPYLFWESSQRYAFHSEGNGFKVEKKDVISFLEKKLTELGLNQKEQTDFITYWGPKLVANENSFVQFSLDEKCDQFATLSCSPQPESIHRVFIQIAEWDPYFELFLNDATFTSTENQNWSLLEWGGFSFTLSEQLSLK